MNMSFDFVTIVFKKHMFKVNINGIHWNTSKSHNLQDILQVDKILDFFLFSS
jgi:hypothetical protein